MSEDPEEPEASVSGSTSQSSEAPPRNAQRGKGRKFFQQMQPSFAIELPRRPTRIEFLDENNPEKATIVRKKAREWVNQNRDQTKKARQKQQHSNTTAQDGKDQTGKILKTENKKSKELVITPSPLRTSGPRKKDQFDSLPDMKIKYDHLMEFCKFAIFS
jgi:hypothetical protein